MADRTDKGETRSPLKRALRAVQDMQAKLDAAEAAKREPIAIIGMGCRFPGGASSPELFWRNLHDGVDTMTEVPPDRWDIDAYYDADPDAPGKMCTRYAGFVEGIQDFDASFFGITPREANTLDPQQRLLLEVSWEALENAGLPPLGLAGSLTGVFVGIWGIDYWYRLLSRELEQLDGYMITGNTHSVATGRLSYMLGLRGPSLSVDTACSSSLVTVHLACQNLRNRSCDLALAGGVNLLLAPENSINLSKLHMLSPDGRCKTFAASADGFGRAEGCGMVVLKRLSDAVADGDTVLAMIRGSAVNQDGRTSGLTVPNGPSQQQVIRRSLEDGGVDASAVSYIEAHGTGTSLGDPIEIGALRQVFGEHRTPQRPLYVGSVKSNIGHTESAAGIAGLIKVVLAVQHEEIPQNLHFHEPNPPIAWEEWPVRVPTESIAWARGERRRVAGISSFGASGTNAHVVVEEPPQPANRHAQPAPPDANRDQHLLTLSAKGAQGLTELTRRYRDHFRDHPEEPIGDLCHTANTGRSHFKDRVGIVASSREEFCDHLSALADGKQTEDVIRGCVDGAESPKVAFLFTGQGAQYHRMGHRLYETEPAFREVIEQCEHVLTPYLDMPLTELLYSAKDQSPLLDQTAHTQPALFAVEYALAELWKAWGVRPDYVIGHSVGEYVAACVAGVFGLEDGLKLVAERARLMQALPRGGRMAAVFAGETTVLEAMNGSKDEVAIAAVNGPGNVVISGRDRAVQAVVDRLEQRGVEATWLAVSHAFHSPLIEPMLSSFERAAGEVHYSSPRVKMISNLTGEFADDQIITAKYWVQHVRSPVRFADGIRALHGAGCDLFLEIGPKPVLAGMGRHCLPEGSGTWLASLRQNQCECKRMLLSLAALYARGVKVDLQGLDRGREFRKVALPTYPFQRSRYWIEVSRDARAPSGSEGGHWMRQLVERNDPQEVLREIETTGRFNRDEATLLAKLLNVFVEEYHRRARTKSDVVADFYDAIPSAAASVAGDAQTGQFGTYLTFGPFHEPVPGFSWVRTFAEPERYATFTRMSIAAQQEMREVLFRHVDFSSCTGVLDFGCGYGSDLIDLAQKHGHLRLCGYTKSPEQAKIGNSKIEALALDGRVSIFNRDSATDDFPERYDLVFGFEVAHHIKDKKALFSNIDRHLNPNGTVVLADFISTAAFAIDHQETSSYFVTCDEWVELLTQHGLEVLECIDISREIANFLEDLQFDQNLEEIDAFKRDPSLRASFKSYDQLARLLRAGLTQYVLVTARKRDGSASEELIEANCQRMGMPIPYSEVSLRGGRSRVAWQAKPLPLQADTSSATPGDATGTWIILADRRGVGEALSRQLERAGGRCVMVWPKERTERVDANHWHVDPRDPSGFSQMIHEILGQAEVDCRGIVHLWPLDSEDQQELSLEDLQAACARSCGSSLFLVQALVGRSSRTLPSLWLVTRGAHAVGEDDGPVRPEQTALWGLGRGVPLEHPELSAGLIDLKCGQAESEANALTDELLHGDGEAQVAIRDDGRFVARLRRCLEPSDGDFTIQQSGTYLIVGGLGALGMHTARWLIENGARSLVLTGRRGLDPPGAADAVRELEASGAEVEVIAADVALPEDAQSVIDRIEAKMPKLRGVVNAAGVLDDGAISKLTWERWERVLAPKVAGTWNLHLLTREMPLDFFVCYSSVASVLGSAGQTHYAAANAFMDGLAHLRQAEGLEGLSVNWGAWADSGMAASLSQRHQQQLADKGVGVIKPLEGVRELGWLLTQKGPQVALCPMNWEKYLSAQYPHDDGPMFFEHVRLVETSEPAALTEDLAAAVLADGSAEERRRRLGTYVRHRVSKVVGQADSGLVDEQLSLLELGVDSLMAVQLRNMIRTELGLDIATGDIINTSSVARLADMLHEQMAVATVVISGPSPTDVGEEVGVI